MRARMSYAKKKKKKIQRSHCNAVLHADLQEQTECYQTVKAHQADLWFLIKVSVEITLHHQLKVTATINVWKINEIGS